MQGLRPRTGRARLAPPPAAQDGADHPKRPRLPPPRPGLFPGWHAVAGAFLVLMVGYGTMYSYAAFDRAIAASFGAAPGSVTLVFALSGGSCFFVSAVAGPLADRVGARVPAAAGMLLVGLGLAVAASAHTLAEVYLGYGLLTGLGTGLAYVPSLAVVQRWFVTHRGLASGLAVSGIGVGTALVPPAADALGALGDWRAAFAACGGLAVLIGLPGAMLLRPPPAAPPGPVVRGVPGRGFGLAYAGTLLVSIPATLPHALLVATARDLGLSAHDALGLLGLVGVGTIAGRFTLAGLADMLGRRAVFLGCCAGLSAAMLLWSMATGEVALQAFALGFGALQGGFVALLPAFVADSFGARSVGWLLGLLYTSRGIALLIAPTSLAFGIAALSGHGWPLVIAAGLGGLGSLLLARVGRG